MSDAVIAAALLVGAAVGGAMYVQRFVAAGGQPMFYQSYFEPALNWTCGHGFVRSAVSPAEPVRAFLATERDSLTCADVVPAVPTREGLYQRAWLYLMLAVGLTWRLVGISWSGLAPLFGVFYGLSIAVSYGLFRHVAGRVVATGTAGMLAMSALHLTNLPHLRDYAKAPFVLALMFLLAQLLTRPATTRRVLGIAAVYGAVLGVGYGFRSDLLANVPPYVVALAFLPVTWRSHLALKAAALGIMALAFLAVAAPVNQQVATTGSCLGHVTLLGFSPPFSDALGVKPAAYDLALVFNDEVLDSMVTGYANRQQPGTGELEYCAPEYDRVTAAYLVDIARVFPGDLITRAYAAARRVLNAPFQSGVLFRLDGAGVPLAAAGLLALSAHHLRLAVVMLLLLLYYGGYPAAQFAPRHYFHLEFIGWLLMAFVVQRLLALMRTGTVPGVEKQELAGVAIFVAVGAAVLVAPLMGARAYQHAAIGNLLSDYLRASAAAAPLEGNVLPGKWEVEFASADLRGRLMTMELEGDAECAVAPQLTIAYRTALSLVEWSRPITLAAAPGKTTVMVPLDASVTRVRLDGVPCARVQRAALIDPAALASPLFLFAQIPPRLEEMNLHQTLQ